MKFAPIGCALGVGLMLASCAPAQVPFRVVFPSEETFVVSNTVHVRAFVAAEPMTCAVLVATVAGGLGVSALPSFDRDGINPCDFDRGVAFPDVGAGQKLFLVEALDEAGSTILAGCTQAEVYGGASITVNLSTTSRYQAVFAANPPTQTAAERCAAGGV